MNCEGINLNSFRLFEKDYDKGTLHKSAVCRCYLDGSSFTHAFTRYDGIHHYCVRAIFYEKHYKS